MSYPEIGKLMDDVFPVVPPRHHGIVKERHHRQILHTYNETCERKKTTCLWKKYMSILVKTLLLLSFLQCFGSGLDPDSIRSVDQDPEGQNWPTKIEKS